jgi:hypothetical protein
MENYNVITFINYAPNIYEKESDPVSIIKTLPNWYKEIPRYFEQEGQDRVGTLKNCAPFFDSMTSGYSLLTPCDIEFYQENGVPKVNILDDRFKDFVGTRGPMSPFHNPSGYSNYHFHWHPSWAIKLPNGYSGLYVTPLNRFELPFIIASGIIDNDKMSLNGLIPFFLQENFSGIIKKGTPFVQIIPIKREEWTSEVKVLTTEEISNQYKIGEQKYRDPKINGYRDLEWQRKSYT